MIYFIYVNKFSAEKLRKTLAPLTMWVDIFLYYNLSGDVWF